MYVLVMNELKDTAMKAPNQTPPCLLSTDGPAGAMNEGSEDLWCSMQHRSTGQLNLEQTFLTSPAPPVTTPMLPMRTMASAKSCRKYGPKKLLSRPE